jgi:two-component system, chemotaxis family, chemotaxis protein CheY
VAKQVIVIDDSETVRRQVSQALAPAGYEVIEAEDGAEGADRIQANRSASLAICDINMPRLNGLDLLEKVRAADAGHLPFIMLTTEGAPHLIERAMKLGAKGWIVKPFKPDLLLAAVRKIAGVAA